MKPQYENEVLSSLLLFIDHEVLKKGEAFSNHRSYFYPVQNVYTDKYVYASPFKQFVSDASIPGANVINSVFVDGVQKNIGQGGLVAIDHYNGQVHFGPEIVGSNRISGSYAVKDFNVYLTSEPEEKLLFETQFSLNPKTQENPAGIPVNSLTYPAIFVKSNGGSNEPGALGGINNTIINARMIVLADSDFSLDAVCSILKDCYMKRLPIVKSNSMPFNAVGAYTGVNYNYEMLATGQGPIIYRTHVTKVVPDRWFFKNANPNIFSAMVDFELSDFRGVT